MRMDTDEKVELMSIPDGLWVVAGRVIGADELDNAATAWNLPRPVWPIEAVRRATSIGFLAAYTTAHNPGA
jgi:hypothetical protein